MNQADKKILAKMGQYSIDKEDTDKKTKKDRLWVTPKIECGIWSFVWEPAKDLRLAMDILETYTQNTYHLDVWPQKKIGKVFAGIAHVDEYFAGTGKTAASAICKALLNLQRGIVYTIPALEGNSIPDHHGIALNNARVIESFSVSLEKLKKENAYLTATRQQLLCDVIRSAKDSSVDVLSDFLGAMEFTEEDRKGILKWFPDAFGPEENT